MTQDVSTGPESDSVSLRTALKTFFGLLAVAVITTIIVLYPGPAALLLAWTFPLGLAAFAPGFDQASGFWLGLGYGCYACVLGFLVNFRRRRIFYSVVACYVILLLVNGVGCAKEKSESKVLMPGKMNCSINMVSAAVGILPGNAS